MNSKHVEFQNCVGHRDQMRKVRPLEEQGLGMLTHLQSHLQNQKSDSMNFLDNHENTTVTYSEPYCFFGLQMPLFIN